MKVPPPGPSATAEAVTAEGLRVRMPVAEDAGKAAQETNMLAKSLSSRSNGRVGGSYKDVATSQNGIKGEVHHMPANKVSPLKFDDGPGIWMEKVDHALTKSYGSSAQAKAYRAQQEALIKAGRFREAQQMDIDDIRNLFGNKYDQAIKEMVQYTESLERAGTLPKPPQ
jgi:hypothetical protein